MYEMFRQMLLFVYDYRLKNLLNTGDRDSRRPRRWQPGRLLGKHACLRGVEANEPDQAKGSEFSPQNRQLYDRWFRLGRAR